MFLENKLKIHIKSGNIFYNNVDTNESICTFFQQQENQSKAKINDNLINYNLLLLIVTKIILDG